MRGKCQYYHFNHPKTRETETLWSLTDLNLYDRTSLCEHRIASKGFFAILPSLFLHMSSPCTSLPLVPRAHAHAREKNPPQRWLRTSYLLAALAFILALTSGILILSNASKLWNTAFKFQGPFSPAGLTKPREGVTRAAALKELGAEMKGCISASLTPTHVVVSFFFSSPSIWTV